MTVLLELYRYTVDVNKLYSILEFTFFFFV